jgi:hypothetical protein
MLATFVSDVVVPVAVLGGMAVLGWWAFANDPHWVSKDGSRFMCRANEVDTAPGARQKWFDVRGYFDDDRVFLASRARKRLRGRGRRPVMYRVAGQPGDDRRGRKLYLLEGDESQVVIRVPPNSRINERLAALIDPS